MYPIKESYANQGTLSEGERLSTFDLHVLTSLGQLIFTLKIFYTFVTKQASLIYRFTVLSLPLQ